VRIAALQRVMAERGNAAALLASADNIRYFTGHYTWNARVPFVLAVVPAHGPATLLVPRADEALARAVSPCALEPYDAGAGGFHTTADLCRRVLERSGVTAGKLGLEFGAVTYDRALLLQQVLPQYTWDDITAAATDLRLEKDPDERETLRRAGTLAAFGMREVASRLRGGMSEIEAVATMDGAVCTEGARRWPEAIVQSQTNAVSGPKLDRLHDAATGRAVQTGEVLFMISKAVVNGYQADIGRTLFVPGAAPADGARRDLDVATSAHRAAVEHLTPGRLLREAVGAADAVLVAAGLADRRTYPMVRGLGLRADERPRVTTDLDLKLTPCMCMCVQMYLKQPGGIVGRSDSVLITDGGPEVLTRAADPA
jgi:Xaa-Pro aminopeptidase